MFSTSKSHVGYPGAQLPVSFLIVQADITIVVLGTTYTFWIGKLFCKQVNVSSPCPFFRCPGYP